MAATTSAQDGGRASRHPAAWFFIILTALLALLFHKSFAPGVVHFSNDNPLGIYAANWVQPPECFKGVWADLNFIGGNAGVWPITFSGVVRWILGPVAYSKFYPPITL